MGYLIGGLTLFNIVVLLSLPYGAILMFLAAPCQVGWAACWAAVTTARLRWRVLAPILTAAYWTVAAGWTSTTILKTWSASEASEAVSLFALTGAMVLASTWIGRIAGLRFHNPFGATRADRPRLQFSILKLLALTSFTAGLFAVLRQTAATEDVGTMFGLCVSALYAAAVTLISAWLALGRSPDRRRATVVGVGVVAISLASLVVMLVGEGIRLGLVFGCAMSFVSAIHIAVVSQPLFLLRRVGYGLSWSRADLVPALPGELDPASDSISNS